MIARGNSASLVNERHGLVSNCRQMNKFTLKCFKEQIECYSHNIICNYMFVPFVLGTKQIL